MVLDWKIEKTEMTINHCLISYIRDNRYLI